MQPTIGPIALFTSAWATFKAYWKPLVAVAAVPSVLFYFGQIFSIADNIALSIAGVIVALAGMVMGIAVQPALITAVQRIHDQPGVQLPLKEQYRNGFRYFWPIVGLAILNGLIAIGGLMLFFIPVVILEVYLSLYLFLRILDDKRGFSAFTESYALIKGRWFKALWRLLFLVLVYGGLSIIVGGVMFLVHALTGIPVKSAASDLISGLLSLVFNAGMMPLAMIYMYNMYASFKATRPQDAGAGAFKGWLIFFLVFGCAIIVAIPVLATIFAGSMSSYPQP